MMYTKNKNHIKTGEKEELQKMLAFVWHYIKKKKKKKPRSIYTNFFHPHIEQINEWMSFDLPLRMQFLRNGLLPWPPAYGY